MIDWEILYEKFKRNKAAEKFEDMALEYVSKYYSDYKWKPTARTRDGNRDFHTLENELLNIWGEAKYKKDKNTSLTRKDLDPTILSGLINGKVELIIFVTNGNIPEPLIERMYLGAKMKGIKLSFVLEAQLSNWLTLNAERYKHYFDEELNVSTISNEQILEIRKVSFFEPISLDFKPNYKKSNMIVDDTFILNCLIFATQTSEGQLCLEKDSPLSILENEYYDNPNKFEIKPGLNIVSFMVKAKREYRNTVNIELKTENNSYFYVTQKIIIKRNNQLDIVFYKQLNIMWKIKSLIDNFDYSIGNYFISIYGNSGMGKSYILNKISHNYCLDNDITLVTFEKNSNSNINYLLLCRIVIFIQYGNLFWNYSLANLKKFCLTYNVKNSFDTKILDDILNGCFDANLAKATIMELVKKRNSIFINSKKNKHFRILLLDDVQFLDGSQSKFLKILIKQQLHSENNNIFIFSSRKNEFKDTSLEKFISDNISNKFELDKLSSKDIKGTLSATFNLKDKDISETIVRELPSNLLILNEVLSNCKHLFETKSEISNTELLDYYIKLFDNELIFQEKFKDLKEQYYLLDIIYFFRKGINRRILYKYPFFNNNDLKNDLRKLKENNCIKVIGKNIIVPFHDYLIENYKKLRSGKEFNRKTGDFFKYLLESNTPDFDTNYLLSIICKCGKRFFNYYNKTIQELMLKYINSSQYGTAIVFAELFYNNISKKEKLTKKDKYYVYLYADCLVHCDNKYRVAEILQKIVKNESMGSFEKYEAQISLLNQKFWGMDLKGIIEDSKMYQFDLENMFMNNLTKDMLGRFRKAYEACFNRRMVTLLLQDEFKLAQKTYRDGLAGLKKFSDLYGLNYDAEIATIIMDYARGNMARNPKSSYRIFNIANKTFKKYKDIYVRRYLICQIDRIVNANIIGSTPDYTSFKTIVDKLKDNNYVAEYIKAIMKYCACKIIDYSRVNNSLDISKDKCILSQSFSQEIIEMIEECRMENYMVLQNREKFLYNNLIAYIYASQKEIELAKKCLSDNLEYVSAAGESYKKPLKHNLKNIETIQYIEWFQFGKKYSKNIYVLESRFW